MSGRERAGEGAGRAQPVRSLGCRRPHRQAGAELLPGQPGQSACTGGVISDWLLCLGHLLSGPAPGPYETSTQNVRGLVWGPLA